MAPAVTLTTDQLLQQITDTKAHLALLEGRLAGLLDQLSTALDNGDIDPQFSHNDWTFTRCTGRTTWQYPAAIKHQIKTLQENAQADGTATQKIGAGYWTIKAPII